MTRSASSKERMRAVHEACYAAVESFVQENGHSDIPADRVVGRTNLRHWWASMRGALKDGRVTDSMRDSLMELAELGAELRTDREIRELHGREVRENVSLGEVERYTPVINAIRTHGRVYGHTRIAPWRTTTNQGLPFGALANAWRRAYAAGNLNSWLATQLGGIKEWTWEVYDPSQRSAVEIPDDTTLMRRAGLKQYLPDE